MSPKLRLCLLTAGAVLGLAATLSLGRWQLSRAAQKEALYAAIESQNRLPPVAQTELLASPQLDTLLHRNVQLRGYWVAQRTVFLDNRQMHDQAGFYVVTPLQLLDSHAVILVQRGWVPRNFLDRTALPRIDTPAGLVDVQGRMAPPPSKLYAFKAVESGPIRQNLDLAAFSAETGLPLMGVSVFQTGPPTPPLQRDWPKANTGVEKHYGYAFQWFGLAALIAILYVWFQIVRRFIPTHSRRREPV